MGGIGGREQGESACIRRGSLKKAAGPERGEESLCGKPNKGKASSPRSIRSEKAALPIDTSVAFFRMPLDPALQTLGAKNK